MAATALALSTDELAELDTLASSLGVHGNRCNDAGMSMVGL
ncbi:hypothetical protein [Amycolatopsis acidicola]|nr:hypothetical protein [Amycolatopsis acidicola]